MSTIVIVGGGISGLYTAYLLQQRGVPFTLLDARGRLGGRVLSEGMNASEASSDDRFDLGPSWFWPELQPRMRRLVHTLQLQTFPQFEEGDLLIERFRLEQVHRVRGFASGNTSLRLMGGMATLVEALASKLPQHAIRLQTRVVRAEQLPDKVRVHAVDGAGELKEIDGASVIFALPPRVLTKTIKFQPLLERSVAKRAASVPTWMAGQAKFVAIYNEPFWRKRGLSGSAQSMLGPLVEMHDASTSSGLAALFGFIGLPAKSRSNLGARLHDECIAQLTRLFGPEANRPVSTMVQDWATEPYTATEADLLPADGHPSASDLQTSSGTWTNRMLLAGSEVANDHAGYLEGALEAAEVAISNLHHLPFLNV